MIGIKVGLKQMIRKELTLGGLLILFWPILYFYPQLAVNIYPFIIGLIFVRYWLQKFEGKKSQTIFMREQENKINHAYTTINDIAHELRSPLAGLKMACEQLSRDPGNKDLVLAMATTFPKQVDKLFLLTNEISKYSKELSREVNLGQVKAI